MNASPLVLMLSLSVALACAQEQPYKTLEKNGLSAIFDAEGKQLTDYLFRSPFIVLPGKKVALLKCEWGGLQSCWDMSSNMLLYDFKGNLLDARPGQVGTLDQRRGIYWIKSSKQCGLLYADGRFKPCPYPVSQWSGNSDTTVFATCTPIDCHQGAWMGKPRLFGWINIRTGEIMPPQFQRVQFQGDSVFARGQDSVFVYSTNKRLLYRIPFSSDDNSYGPTWIYKEKKRQGLVNAAYQRLTPPKYDEIKRTDFDLFWYRIGRKYGILALDGKEITAALYDSIFRFKADRADYFFDDKIVFCAQKAGKFGVLHREKGELIAPIYDSIQVLDNQLFKAYSQRNAILLNGAGRQILRNFHFVQATRAGTFIVERDGKYGLADSAGRLLLPTVYDSIQCPKYYSHLFVFVGKHVGAASLMGNIYLPPGDFEALEYRSIDQFIGKVKGLYGIWDSSGHVILPPEYQSIKRDIVEKNGLFGKIDAKGAFELPLKYNKLETRLWPCAFRSIEGVDTTDWSYSKRVLKPFSARYDSLEAIRFNSYFLDEENRGYTFRKNGKIGLLNNLDSLQLLIPPLYDQLQAVHRPELFAITRRGNQIELLKDPKGTVMARLSGDHFDYRPDDRMLHFSEIGKSYAYDLFRGRLHDLAVVDTATLFDRNLEGDLYLDRSFQKIGSEDWVFLGGHEKKGAYNAKRKKYFPPVYNRIMPIDSTNFFVIQIDLHRMQVFNAKGDSVSAPGAFSWSHGLPANAHSFVLSDSLGYRLFKAGADKLELACPEFFSGIEPVNGCYIVEKYDGTNLRYGLLSLDGAVLLKPVYWEIKAGKNGKWMVRKRENGGFSVKKC